MEVVDLFLEKLWLLLLLLLLFILDGVVVLVKGDLERITLLVFFNFFFFRSIKKSFFRLLSFSQRLG